MQNKQANNLQQFRLFVERNPQLLQNLYSKCFTDNEFTHMSEVPRKELLNFTRELFGFNREPFNTGQMKQTIDISLMESFINYEQENPEEQLQLKSVIKLLEYCIETNKTFAVEYNPKSKQQDSKDEPKEQADQQPEQNQQDQHQAKQQETHEQKQPSERIDTKERTQTQPTGNKPDQEAAVARRLAIVFDFYCKQQQNVGTNTTFDRISHECSVMNLGKFLIFCHGYGVTSEQLNKYALMERYKKIAEGRKEIGFEKFVELVKSLKDIDPQLTARVNLDSEKMFKQKLKILNIPFSTKGGMKHEPTIMHHPKLTSHSGKTSEELMEYLEAKKLEKRSLDRHVSTPIPSPPLPRKYKQVKRQSKLKSKVSRTHVGVHSSNPLDPADEIKGLGLDRLIIMEETDDEWLKQYKLHTATNKPETRQQSHQPVQTVTHQNQRPDLTSSVDRSSQHLKPMVPSNTRAILSSSKTIIEPPAKNDSIVSGIRKRIAEISRSENARESLNLMKLNTMNTQQERKLSHIKNRI